MKATYQQEQRVQQLQIKQLTDSTTKLGNYNQELRQRESDMIANRRKVENAINNGKRLIEKTMQQTNIDRHLDTLSNILYIWSDFTNRCQAGERAIEKYLKQIDNSFSDIEKDEIRNSLNRHNEAIVTKWRNKIVNISK